MIVSLAPNESNIYTALRSFLLSILPTPGIEVVQGQPNRVPEPSTPDFVVMTSVHKPRLATNIDNYVDTVFTASIVGNVMTVTSVQKGVIVVGAQVFGANLAAGTTTVTGFVTGTGGTGDYNVSIVQGVSSETMASGLMQALQKTEVIIQLDVHGPNSSDNTEIITTLFRDEFAVSQFASSGFDVTPLYTDDPKQIPFINAESQYETRWVIDAHLQANAVVTVPQQFAGTVGPVNTIDVDVAYPG